MIRCMKRVRVTPEDQQPTPTSRVWLAMLVTLCIGSGLFHAHAHASDRSHARHGDARQLVVEGSGPVLGAVLADETDNCIGCRAPRRAAVLRNHDIGVDPAPQDRLVRVESAAGVALSTDCVAAPRGPPHPPASRES